MKRIISAILLAALLITVAVPCAFAKEANASSVYVAKDFNEFLKQTQTMLDNSPLARLRDGKNVDQDFDLKDVFQTGRIIVRPDKPIPKDILKKSTDAIAYDDCVILQFKTRKAAKSAYNALLERYGKARVAPDVIFKASIPRVQSLAPLDARDIELDGPYLSWGVCDMGLDKMLGKLNVLPDKSDVTVAVLDTGINFLDSVTETGRIAGAFDAVMMNNLPQDFNGHGTFCAGVISESTPASVKIMPVKVMNALGFGSLLSILIGLFYTAQMHPDVVSMSLGGFDVDGFHYMDDFFKEIRANKGCIVVASGNESTDVKNCYPANSEYVITVAALKKNNKVDKSYSNFGDCIDFAAPGTNVGGRYCLTGIPVLMELTGTSMATPHVAAACALVKTVHKNYDQDQVYKVLKSCAIDIDQKGKDKWSGWGRIDMSNYAAKL